MFSVDFYSFRRLDLFALCVACMCVLCAASIPVLLFCAFNLLNIFTIQSIVSRLYFNKIIA